MLQLDYDVQPDAHGVFDGRILAEELIRDAYRLLAPYAHDCPACTDILFSVIANRVIEAEPRDEEQSEKLGKGTILFGAKDATLDDFFAHRDGSKAVTEAIFAAANRIDHDHNLYGDYDGDIPF